MSKKIDEIYTDNNSSSLISYVCKDCQNTFSTPNKNEETCIYCNSKNIKLTKGYSFDKATLIPFTQDLENIKKLYKKKVRFNPLIPFKFKRRKFVDSIKKVYFPAYLLDVSYKGDIDFLAGDKTKIKVDGQKLIELKKYEVSVDINMDYSKVLINACSRLDEGEFRKVLSYDFETDKKIKEDYFKNSYVMDPDLSSNDIVKATEDTIINNSLRIVRKKINHQLKKIENNNTKVSLEAAKQLLLPVYFLNLKYRDKNYHFLANGTNDKVYYKFPLGIVEIIVLSLLICGIAFVLIYLVATML